MISCLILICVFCVCLLLLLHPFQSNEIIALYNWWCDIAHKWFGFSTYKLDLTFGTIFLFSLLLASLVNWASAQHLTFLTHKTVFPNFEFVLLTVPKKILQKLVRSLPSSCGVKKLSDSICQALNWKQTRTSCLQRSCLEDGNVFSALCVFLHWGHLQAPTCISLLKATQITLKTPE